MSLISKSKQNYDQIKNELLDSNSISFWLKNAIKDIERRDSLDMMRDIELLADLHKKYREKFNMPF